jgi:imidazolonepropionase-like amidohydrolase
VYKDKIVEVSQSKTFPDSVIILDLKGLMLMPGLMDVHTHILSDGTDLEVDLYQNSSSYRALRAVQHLSIALQNGFTTVRDLCSEGAEYADVDISRAIESGFITGPRVFASGRGIAATGAYLPRPRKQNWELDLPSGTQYVSGEAELLGIEKSHGSVQKGFMTDIIAVRGNPLNDITLLQQVSFVMKSEKIYKQPSK